MRKNILIAIVVVFLLFPAAKSFSLSREQIIEDTLTAIDTVYAVTSPQSANEAPTNVAPTYYKQEIYPATESQDLKGTFYISAGYNANHMHYKEFSGERTLDEDYGKLKGFYSVLGYRSNLYLEWLLGKPFIEGYYRRYDELITYDGGSSLGPLAFKERAEVHRYGVKLGAYKEFSEKGEVLGYLDVGQRVWYRGENEIIEGVLTYAEKYRWTYFGFGLGANYRFIPQLSLGIDTEWMFAPNSLARMRADLYEGGTFKLGRVFGTEVKVPVKYHLTKHVSLDVTPYFTYWDINKSSLTEISGLLFYEPDSKTHIEGVLTGLTVSF